MINFRVIKTVVIDDIPKNNAVLILTNPLRKLLNEPNKDVDPTTNKEYDVAIIGLSIKTYTSIGTIKIEPPPPINPNEIPTSADKK